MIRMSIIWVGVLVILFLFMYLAKKFFKLILILSIVFYITYAISNNISIFDQGKELVKNVKYIFYVITYSNDYRNSYKEINTYLKDDVEDDSALRMENEKLKSYMEKIEELPHGKLFNGFHSLYVKALSIGNEEVNIKLQIKDKNQNNFIENVMITLKNLINDIKLSIK